MVRIQKPTSNVEDGIYTLLIGKSKFKTVQDFQTHEDVQRIEIEFTCLDGESEGESFTDLFTDSVGPRSKLGKVYRAAKKTDNVPDDWDTEDLEGDRFQALVQANDSGWPKIAPDSIKPAKPKAKKSEPVRSKRVVEESDEDTWDDEDAA